jgi:PhoPQ-activated pathogenicity-related protein
MRVTAVLARVRALLALLGALAGCAAGADEPSAATALARYVAAEDASYAWFERGRSTHRGAQIVELTLHSQAWRGTLWKHQLVLIKPRAVAHGDRALLIVGGGRWRPEYELPAVGAEFPEDGALFLRIANRLRTVVVVLGQVPHQPLFDLTEDRLIAHTFERYLATGEESWPLLLPMVKSTVRAMDAAQEFAGREWGSRLAQFTVVGGSKRGWTTWLTGAVDSRATAIAPAVIDALNMASHFPHQRAFWGAPSPEIEPYTALGLDSVLSSTAGEPLRRIVDPYEYRAALQQPKLVILATNDEYFPLDSANLYWDALAEPKYLLYLPNEQHDISDYSRVVAGLRALHDAAGGGAALPRFAWEYRWSAAGVALCVRADPAPAALRLWTAASGRRDFRDAVWDARDATHSPGRDFEIARPRGGFSAVFAEAVFGRGRSSYSLSTNVAVLAPSAAADVGVRPRGTAGVCAGAGADARE